METEQTPGFFEVLLSQLQRRLEELPKGTKFECQLFVQTKYEPSLQMDVRVEVEFIRLRSGKPDFRRMPGLLLRWRINRIFNEVMACIPSNTPTEDTRNISLARAECFSGDESSYRIELGMVLYGSECQKLVDTYVPGANYIKYMPVFCDMVV